MTSFQTALHTKLVSAILASVAGSRDRRADRHTQLDILACTKERTDFRRDSNKGPHYNTGCNIYRFISSQRHFGVGFTVLLSYSREVPGYYR